MVSVEVVSLILLWLPLAEGPADMSLNNRHACISVLLSLSAKCLCLCGCFWFRLKHQMRWFHSWQATFYGFIFFVELIKTLASLKITLASVLVMFIYCCSFNATVPTSPKHQCWADPSVTALVLHFSFHLLLPFCPSFLHLSVFLHPFSLPSPSLSFLHLSICVLVSKQSDRNSPMCTSSKLE